jgi:hypothetical protein
LSRSKIIVFLKSPILGTVKTRIGKTEGNEKALAIYELLLEACFSTLSIINLEKHLFYTPSLPSKGTFDTTASLHIQSSGNLGDRMNAAFEKICEEGCPVLLIGSDCPYITPQIIEEASAALQSNDTVLGPTEDGGYYLIGMKKPHPFLFENIKWSTSSVFSETIDKILANKMSCHFLPILNDIDEIVDWNKYQS